MQWYEILVIVLAAAFVAAIVVWQVIRKKKGKGGCDCGGTCTQCPHCKANETHKEKPQ